MREYSRRRFLFMQREVLEKHLQNSGFDIVDFEAHPQFFGSWFAVVEASGRRFRLLYEGRDARLFLQRFSHENWLDVHSEFIATFSEDQDAQLCAQVLQEIS